MKKKNLLQIGTIVKVKAECVGEKKYQNHENTYYAGEINRIVSRIKPRHKMGVIVGGTYIREGVIDYDFESGVYFRAKGKTLFVYLVRPAFTMKPMKVLPEDIDDKTGDDLHNQYIKAKMTKVIPFSGSIFAWGEQERNEMKAIMADVQRDEKGRWK